MFKDLQRGYWWNGMKREVTSYVLKYLTYQQVKIEHQKSGGMMQQMEIPQWKWKEITMDFVVGLPKTRKQHDAIWVIVDRLTKAAHFLPIRINQSLESLGRFIHQRNCSTTWSTSLYHIKSRSSVYFSILGPVATGLGYKTEAEYRFSSTDRRTIKEDYPDTRRYVASMYAGLER